MLLWQTRPAHHARKRSTPGRVSGLGRLAPSALGLGRDLAGRVRRRDDQTLGDLPLRDNGLRVIAGHSGEASPRQLPRAQRCQDDELERSHVGGAPDHRTPVVAALVENAEKPVIGPSQSSALVRARAGKGLRAQKSRCVEYTANACAAPPGAPHLVVRSRRGWGTVKSAAVSFPFSCGFLIMAWPEGPMRERKCAVVVFSR